MPDCVTIRVPATSANLGCMFDCGALALSLYLDVRVTLRGSREIAVQYRGETPERIASGADNLIARTLSDTLQGWGVKRGFDLEIDNQIPVGVGLGSSAAAIVAALSASHWLANRDLPDQEIISMGSRLEGHPDNVAAAWEGGFTLAVQADGRVLAFSCPVSESLQFALVVPDYAVATENARAMLPATYSRADAVHNLQRAAAVAAQFFAGRTDFRRELFDDRWHQPYRVGLVPGLKEVLGFSHPEILGLCLSGAGPAILAFVRGDARPAVEAIQALLGQQGVPSRAFALAADNRGAKSWSQPSCR
ncbi:MAG TPA: homoserine kinase [Terriglobia bacterium]|nr:homoserine kinase [Terriglobia bacterium]